MLGICYRVTKYPKLSYLKTTNIYYLADSVGQASTRGLVGSLWLRTPVWPMSARAVVIWPVHRSPSPCGLTQRGSWLPLTRAIDLREGERAQGGHQSLYSFGSEVPSLLLYTGSQKQVTPSHQGRWVRCDYQEAGVIGNHLQDVGCFVLQVHQSERRTTVGWTEGPFPFVILHKDRATIVFWASDSEDSPPVISPFPGDQPVPRSLLALVPLKPGRRHDRSLNTREQRPQGGAVESRGGMRSEMSPHRVNRS